jgi:hypothetical protein
MFEEFEADLAALDEGIIKTALKIGLDTLMDVTAWLQSPDRDADARAAGATPYLRLFATTLGGFLLAKALVIAEKAGDADRQSRADSARFFVQQVLPPALALLPAIKMGSIPQPQQPG